MAHREHPSPKLTPRQSGNIFALPYALWKKYAGFSGRARRREFWLFSFMVCLGWIALFSYDASVGMCWTWFFVTLTPTLALLTRRLHDVGKSSGWWLLHNWLVLVAIRTNNDLNSIDDVDTVFFIVILPWFLIVNTILFVFLLRDSQAGDNKYGANPKAAASHVSRLTKAGKSAVKPQAATAPIKPPTAPATAITTSSPLISRNIPLDSSIHEDAP